MKRALKQKEAVDLLTEKRWKRAGMHLDAWCLAKEMIAPQASRCDARQALNHAWLRQYEAAAAGCCTIS